MFDFKKQVADFLSTREDPVKLSRILRSLAMQNSDRAYLRDLLAEMVKEGSVIREGSHYWVPKGKQISLAIKREKSAQRNELVGRLSINRYGEGFVANPRGKDWFIPGNALLEAKSGDTVKARLTGRPTNGKFQGEIISIESFGVTVTVGIFEGQGREKRFIPFGDLKIDRKDLTDFPIDVPEESVGRFDRQENGTWKFSGILGNMEDPAVDEAIVLAENQIPETFSEEVMAACSAFDNFEFVPEGRTDFQDSLVFTIDGETARDFDDALHLTPMPNGQTEVGIHIADVSHFVHPGSVLDALAEDRGNSVYLPHKAIPMLPERLSTELCSLKPDEPRYSLSVVCILDDDAQVVSAKIVKGFIRSAFRLTYTLVDGMCSQRDEALRKRYEKVVPSLDLAMALAQKMKARRAKAGGLSLDMPEVRATMDLNGLLAEIQLNHQTDANRLIEAFMCLANEIVAQQMSDLEIGIPYRVHDVPEMTRLEDLANFWKSRAFPVPANLLSQTGPALNEMIEKLKDNASGEVLQLQILKSLKLAEYSPENRGHFGLASTHYAHFTSPIRRYADLIVHQRISQMLTLAHPGPEHFDSESLANTCLHISKRERAAGKAEQTYLLLKQLRYMLEEVGKEFDGVILEVKPFGAFVRMLPIHMAGLMHVDAMTDDTYELDTESLALVGKHGGRVWRVGDQLKVRVDLVDLLSRRVNISPVGMPDQRPIKKPKFFEDLKKHPIKSPPRPKPQKKGHKCPGSIRKKGR